MIRKNWFAIFTCCIICAWTLAFYVDLKAEEDEINVSAEEITEEDDDYVNINDSIEDIREEVEELIELQKESNKDNTSYHDEYIKRYEELIDKLGNAYVIEEDQEVNYKKDGEILPEEEQTEESTQVGMNEEEVENDGNEDNSISDNAEYTDSFIQIHEDLQKIMISIWALAGLFLGSKLISRMFGNG